MNSTLVAVWTVAVAAVAALFTYARTRISRWNPQPDAKPAGLVACLRGRWARLRSLGQRVAGRPSTGAAQPATVGCPACGGEGLIGGLLVWHLETGDEQVVDELCYSCRGTGVRGSSAPPPGPGAGSRGLAQVGAGAPRSRVASNRGEYHRQGGEGSEPRSPTDPPAPPAPTIGAAP